MSGHSGRNQQLTGLLETHQQQQKQLMAERHKLLVQNGALLHDYIRSGLKLPGPSSDEVVNKREMLVAQLVQEEGAARAALEALKRGTTLAKAREIGESVMRQAQELAAPVVVHDPAVTAISAEPSATDDQGVHERASKGKSVWLMTPIEAVAAAGHTRQQQASSTAVGVTGLSYTDLGYGGGSSSRAAAGGLGSLNGAGDRISWQRDDPAANVWQQPPKSQRQQHLPDQDAPPAYIQELKAQVTALQSALESQMRTAPNPWNQLLPAAMTAAAVMANPAAAVAAASAQPGSLFSPGLGVMPGMTTAGPSGLTQELLASDPSLAAAAAAHARDMALLRMDVEKARGVAELQQLKSQLVQLQQTTSSNGRQQYPAAREFSLDLGEEQTAGLNGGQQLQDSQPGVQPMVDDDTGSLQHKLCDPDDYLSGLPAITGQDADNPSCPAPAAAGGNESAATAVDEELLGIEQGSAVMAARGSNADTDVLQVHITTAGPFTKRGTYRVCVVLYEGYQPVESAPGVQISASTSKRAVVPPGSAAAAAAAAVAAQQGDTPSDSSSVSSSSPGMASFNERLSLKGMKLASSTQLVFELYMAKPGLAGLPTKELLVGWTTVPLLQSGQIPLGLQSMPLFRLPLMLTAQRKFTYDHALLEFKVTHYRGAPGDVDVSTGASASSVFTANGGPAGPSSVLEDIPGVPSTAWVRVQRGVPPADPYTPGDGFVVVVDGARFLPCSTTISKVIGSVWSSSGSLLAGPFEGVAQPDSDAFSPAFTCSATLGSNLNGTRFEDPTATLMLQVHTIERTSRSVRVVGFALVSLFLDPKSGAQPVSRSIQDYVLNQGAFQVPLHAGSPSTTVPLRVTSLDDVPRLPCASLLIRLLTTDAAKLQRRKPTPQYPERVYDSVSRCLPTALERKLYAKVIQRRPFTVREAARLVAWFSHQPGGLGGSRRTTTSNAPSLTAATAAAAAGTSSAAPATSSKLLARVFGSGNDDEAAAAAIMNTGDPAAATEQQQQELELSKTEPLPPTDPEIMDWISDTITNATAAAAVKAGNTGSSSNKSAELMFINYNTGYEYSPDLGFFVALDGAARLSRLLPAAGLISYSPPGSLYQDQPVVDEVKVTLDYDLDAPLAAPRWLDGYQQFADVPYHPGLVLLFDVRCIVPGSGSSAPVGWACLPVFERAGRFVATGTYHLPLFQGIPSLQLLADLSSRGDPDAAMCAAIKSGRVRPSVECSSVLVRLMCGSRQGQLEVPAWSCNMQDLRLPRYVVSELGAKFVGEMRKIIKNKTYSQAKPKALTDEQWVDQINDTLIKVAGLDDNLAATDADDEREGSSRQMEDEEAAEAAALLADGSHKPPRLKATTAVQQL